MPKILNCICTKRLVTMIPPVSARRDRQAGTHAIKSGESSTQGSGVRAGAIERFIQPDEETDCWFANASRDRQGSIHVVCTCADTRFGFALWDLCEQDLADLEIEILQGIRQTLCGYGFAPELLEQYIPAEDSRVALHLMGESALETRGMQSNMQVLAFVERYYQEDPWIPQSVHYIPFVSDAINRHPYYQGQCIPLEDMISRFQARYQMQPIQMPGYVCKATLRSEQYPAVRVFTMAQCHTFSDLHFVLLVAFGMAAFPVHESILSPDQRAGGREGETGAEDIHILSDYVDITDLGAQYVHESDALLSQYLYKGTQFPFYYYCGDGSDSVPDSAHLDPAWVLDLEVLEETAPSGALYPVCTLCEGELPIYSDGLDVWLSYLQFQEAKCGSGVYDPHHRLLRNLYSPHTAPDAPQAPWTTERINQKIKMEYTHRAR